MARAFWVNLPLPSTRGDDDNAAFQQTPHMSEREQSWQSGDVEDGLHVGGPIHQRQQKAAHVVEPEGLQLFGGDRRDQDGRLRTNGGQTLPFERLAGRVVPRRGRASYSIALLMQQSV
jgi:hypothetical protein